MLFLFLDCLPLTRMGGGVTIQDLNERTNARVRLSITCYKRVTRRLTLVRCFFFFPPRDSSICLPFFLYLFRKMSGRIENIVTSTVDYTLSNKYASKHLNAQPQHGDDGGAICFPNGQKIESDAHSISNVYRRVGKYQTGEPMGQQKKKTCESCRSLFSLLWCQNLYAREWRRSFSACWSSLTHFSTSFCVVTHCSHHIKCASNNLSDAALESSDT